MKDINNKVKFSDYERIAHLLPFYKANDQSETVVARNCSKNLRSHNVIWLETLVLTIVWNRTIN